MRVLTRVELADTLCPAFGPSGATRAALVETAQNAGCDAQVIDMLGRLPAHRYPDMQTLWHHLPAESHA